MASESLTPPPSGGGSAKYIVILLVLLAGGLGVYFAMRKAPEPPKEAAPPPKNAEPSAALEQNTVEIPVEEPEEPDAGVVAPEPPKRKVIPAGDPWSCAGDIPAASIRKVLGEEQAAVRSCYERQLRNNNVLQGSIKLQVRVGNDGKVGATRVSGSLKDADVKNCVQNVAKNWSFPAPAGGTCAVFEAPFNFTPKP